METLTIEIDPDSALARTLEAADARLIVLVSGGARYTLKRVTDELWQDYDPEHVRAAVRDAAGTFTPEEGERLKELVYRGREEGTRPIRHS